MRTTEDYDLVVIGSGAAGLSAALSYAEAATGRLRPPRIALLERSAEDQRGGATRWTGAFLRITEERRLDPTWADRVRRVSGDLADYKYCKTLERETPATLKFIEDHGVELVFSEFPIVHTLADGTPTMIPPGYPNGGGAAIVTALSRALDSHPGVDTYFQAEARRLITDDDGAVNGVIVRGPDARLTRLGAKAVVLACGGFEGNPEMLTRYLGANACDLPLLAPGIAGNRGDGLRMALELGADTAGQFDMIHAEPVDRRSSAADAVLYGYTGGIFVNGNAERFFDEGSDTWDNTFELIGYQIWRHQNQEAYWIADATSLNIPGIRHAWLSDLPPEQADTLADLAGKLGLAAGALAKTVAEFNAAVGPGEFDHTRFDGKAAAGLTPPKSNWATPLNTPPYIGFPITAAICFTYGGVRTDTSARVVTPAGVPIPGLYAAGEVTGLFYHQYPPATSVLRSLAFGRLAGQHAAAAACCPAD